MSHVPAILLSGKRFQLLLAQEAERVPEQMLQRCDDKNSTPSGTKPRFSNRPTNVVTNNQKYSYKRPLLLINFSKQD